MLKRCFKPKYARLDPIYDLILRFFYFESLGVRQFFEKSAICFIFEISAHVRQRGDWVRFSCS